MPARSQDDARAAGDQPAPLTAAEAAAESEDTLPLKHAPGTADFAEAVLLRLTGRGAPHRRYAVRDEVAQGGQGIVLRVWDEDLHRHLAMKVMLDPDAPGGGATPPGLALPKSTHSLGRFLDEAQVTGQLDHPGIVPVHDLGLDGAGRVYFTMKLVSGQDLRAIFRLVDAEADGWNRIRALGVLLKVCEAMAYAHSKGVIHRDLKPSNIMVGRFGEVYVMDWGLARVEGREDERDVRVRPVALNTSLVHTDRREATTPDAPLVTMDGDVVGTPSYMCPEQARGAVESMGPHSDVYSLGAILYDLLAGSMPYVKPGMRVNNYAVWSRVQEGPPLPLEVLAPDVPPELAAICHKAMARPIPDRYPDMAALADDLRAYLEGRVVHAYETGAVAELRKWVTRNKPLAGALAAAVVLLVAGLAVSWSFYVAAEGNAVLAAQNAAEAERRADESAANAARAEANAQHALLAQRDAVAEKERADERTADVLRLADMRRLRLLEERADALWPPYPDMLAAYDTWLADVASLGERLALHRQTLARMSTATLASTSTSTEEAWQRDVLAELVPGIEALSDEQDGVVADVRTRRAIAAALGPASVSGPKVAPLWERAIAAIAASPHYGGLTIKPQMGLVPIGPDPETGLWEFSHVLSGAIPPRDTGGALRLEPTFGVVFVLLPGGTTRHGAQPYDGHAPNFDPYADGDEYPVREVTLAPFFMSKFELTQAQWLRLDRRNPAWNQPPTTLGGRVTTLQHPVEQVSWSDCTRVLRRWGMDLPTEVQWEYAARAGTTTPWWTGEDRESLAGAVNLSDAYRADNGGPPGQLYETWLDDGYYHHAPAGTYRPNAFGLHEIIGNVWEWCRDAYDSYASEVTEGDAERIVGPGHQTNIRGGGFQSGADDVRSAIRRSGQPDNADVGLGVRPMRALER